MQGRIVVSPRFELFLALAEILRPATEATAWLNQARRKLDPASRRRMGDLALSPAFWTALAAVPEAAALEDDSTAVIAALAALRVDDFARRTRHALHGRGPDPALDRLAQRLGSDPAGLQQAVTDGLRRFDRLAFAALWRRVQPDLEQAARETVAPAKGIVLPSLFGAHRFQFGDTTIATVSPGQGQAITRKLPPARLSAADAESVLRALGDATRYAIARLIAQEALTGAALARRLGVSGPTLTHHLRQLRAARLVIEEPRGNSILLRLDRRTIEALSGAVLEDLFGGRPVTIRRSRRA